jgi:phosphatidylglycerol:prolipoprotein diacylglycerol transferase
MASHGGIIGVFTAMIIWGKKNKIPAAHLFDIAALFTTPGLFYGRIANFINGELWGRALPGSLQTNSPWWSVKYPTEITQSWLVTPELFQEQLQGVESLRTEVVGGELFYNTIVTEAYAGNQQVIETITPLLTAWYPSQLFQALAEGPILFCVLFVIWWKPRKPGIIAGWFVVCYGILRIATEAFRQPDDGVALLFGLSRGQVLSAVMILFGVVLVLVSTRSKATKIGGFGSIFSRAQGV